MTVQAGDELRIHSVAPLGTYDIIIVAAVNGEFNFTSAPNGYYTTGPLELERGGVNTFAVLLGSSTDLAAAWASRLPPSSTTLAKDQLTADTAIVH